MRTQNTKYAKLYIEATEELLEAMSSYDPHAHLVRAAALARQAEQAGANIIEQASAERLIESIKATNRLV